MLRHTCAEAAGSAFFDPAQWLEEGARLILQQAEPCGQGPSPAGAHARAHAPSYHTAHSLYITFWKDIPQAPGTSADPRHACHPCPCLLSLADLLEYLSQKKVDSLQAGTHLLLVLCSCCLVHTTRSVKTLTGLRTQIPGLPTRKYQLLPLGGSSETTRVIF